MGIIAKKPLRDFWERHPDAKQPLEIWYREVKREIWDTPHDLKAKYQKASIIGDNRVVFDIGNNQFRLIVRVNYQYHQVYIRFIGTHSEYDDLIDAKGGVIQAAYHIWAPKEMGSIEEERGGTFRF